MFSSATDMWETPQDLFDAINAVFKFDVDVCASAENNKCKEYYTLEVDGLKQSWEGMCWMNPPYGRNVTDKWVQKAYESAREGATVVCLLPARTDTIYWHEYCAKGEVLLIKGRLKFGNSKDSAPFPSALVVFRPNLLDTGIKGMFA